MRRAVLSKRALAFALVLLSMPCVVQSQDADADAEDTFQLGEKKTGDYTLCQDIVKEIRKKGQALYHTPGPTPANMPAEDREDYELRNGKDILIGWKSIPGESCMSCSPTQEQCPTPCIDLRDYMYWACDGDDLREASVFAVAMVRSIERLASEHGVYFSCSFLLSSFFVFFIVLFPLFLFSSFSPFDSMKTNRQFSSKETHV